VPDIDGEAGTKIRLSDLTSPLPLSKFEPKLEWLLLEPTIVNQLYFVLRLGIVSACYHCQNIKMLLNL
jgi:hypothetical protein